MQTLAAEHKSSYDKIEADLQTLQEDYAALEKELQEKDTPEQRAPVVGEVRELREQVKDLQAELEQVEFEKVDLEDQVESLKKDAAQLIEKDGKVAKDRAEERRTLQNVYLPAGVEGSDR